MGGGASAASPTDAYTPGLLFEKRKKSLGLFSSVHGLATVCSRSISGRLHAACLALHLCSSQEACGVVNAPTLMAWNCSRALRLGATWARVATRASISRRNSACSASRSAAERAALCCLFSSEKSSLKRPEAFARSSSNPQHLPQTSE